MVTPVAKFKSASSRTKILRLIVLRSNLKLNLQILSTETRTLKISKFEKLTFSKTEFLGEEGGSTYGLLAATNKVK